MEEKISCEKCGAPLESGSSVCLACEGDSKVGKRLRQGGRRRISLARLYSGANGTKPSGSKTLKDVGQEVDVGEESQHIADASSTDVEVDDDHTHVGPSDPKHSSLASAEIEAIDEEEPREESSEDLEEVSDGKSSVEKLDTILSGIASKDADSKGLKEEEEGDIDSLPAMPVRKQVLRLGESVPKIRTYVEGFDEALGGGIPKGNIVLLSGTAGAMKSTLAYYILYTNILSRGAKCLYITLEQTLQSLLTQMSAIGMDPISAGGSLRMFDMGFIRKHIGKSKKNWFKLFIKNVDNLRAHGEFDLMVIDSLEALEVLADFKNRRADLFRLFEWLRDLKTTTLIITERSDCPFGKHLSHLKNEEEFLADGIINLALHSINEIDVQRRIRCFKMRGTKHEAGYLSLMWDDGKFKVTKSWGR